MSLRSGDLCRYVNDDSGRQLVEHFRCDEHADGTLCDVRTLAVVQPAPSGALRGFIRQETTR